MVSEFGSHSRWGVLEGGMKAAKIVNTTEQENVRPQLWRLQRLRRFCHHALVNTPRVRAKYLLKVHFSLPATKLKGSTGPSILSIYRLMVSYLQHCQDYL